MSLPPSGGPGHTVSGIDAGPSCQEKSSRVSLRRGERLCEALEQAFNLGHAFIQGCDILPRTLTKGGNVFPRALGQGGNVFPRTLTKGGNIPTQCPLSRNKDGGKAMAAIMMPINSWLMFAV